ncbi:helix-turn-helix domain-containing protein [Scytonema sp. NUACC26]|uniref:helix-turn-helix domain-containing protein n=1 Tax=Scytonema sp. NUACC26 TaxID=3140176 RepID=UPI0034DC1CD3
MSDNLSIFPAQCRAARALLGWSQEELSKKANVARATVADFEREARVPVTNNMLAIKEALERGGVEFIYKNGSGIGVQLRVF